LGTLECLDPLYTCSKNGAHAKMLGAGYFDCEKREKGNKGFVHVCQAGCHSGKKIIGTSTTRCKTFEKMGKPAGAWNTRNDKLIDCS